MVNAAHRTFGKRSTVLWALIAIVLSPALSDARVTQIQITSRTVAFMLAEQRTLSHITITTSGSQSRRP